MSRTLDRLRADTLYPRVVRACADILATGNLVTPVEVVARLGWLLPAQRERWERGEVAYLERVVQTNLSKISRVLRILRMHAHDLKLVPRETRPCQRGTRRPLRFTKTNEPNVEAAWARSFLWPAKRPFGAPKPVSLSHDLSKRGIPGEPESASREPSSAPPAHR